MKYRGASATEVQQPAGSRLCGQVAVANLVGCSLRTSIDAFGGSMRGTTTQDIQKALIRLGLHPRPGRLLPWHPAIEGVLHDGLPAPRYGIAKMGRLNWKGKVSSRGWHWVAIIDGEIVDGQNGDRPAGYRLSSFLRLEDRP